MSRLPDPAPRAVIAAEIGTTLFLQTPRAVSTPSAAQLHPPVLTALPQPGVITGTTHMFFASPAVNATGPKATRIDLFSFATPQMRAFYLTWMAFFVCFFAWFAAAPLMPLIKAEFGLTKDQIAKINIAASYYVDRFGLTLGSAGAAAGIFGGLALFARALRGLVTDKIAVTKGLDGQTALLFALMLGEGLGLLWFGSASSAMMAIFAMTIFGIFTHMACGATYALVPFIDRKALGGVAGIIGAGGNVGGGHCGLRQ